MTPRTDPASLDPGPPPPPPEPPATAPASAADATPPSDTGSRDSDSRGAGSRGTGDRFFAWTTGIGIVRGDGWIGGVAAGLAARLRIDPLIVRGILVVAALFGFPALFGYACAWAVLPDLNDRIPLRDALRRRFEASQLGITALAALGLVPFTPAALFALGLTDGPFPFRPDAWSPLATVAAVVGLVLVAWLLFLIVRAAVRGPRAIDPMASGSGRRTASAASDAPGPSAAASGSGPDARFAGEAEVDADDVDDRATASIPAPSASAAPSDGTGADASPDDAYAAWRAQHAAWKTQDDAWRREQQDAARAAREQARRERHAQAAAFSSEAAERRRRRRLSSPRTPFAYVATVLGLAAVAGALVAVTATGDRAASAGLFVAATICALGMIVAGIARRRGGFLAFTTLVLLMSGLAGAAIPTLEAQHALRGSYSITNAPGAPRWPRTAPFVQPWGSTSVTVFDTRTPTDPIYIEKDSGETYVYTDPGVALDIDITAPPGAYVSSDDGDVELQNLPGVTGVVQPDGRIRSTGTIGDGTDRPATTRQTLVVDQRAWLTVILQTPFVEDSP